MISITHTELRGDYQREGLVAHFDVDLPDGPLTGGAALLECILPRLWELPIDIRADEPDRWICPDFQAALAARVPDDHDRGEIYREIRKALACVYH